MRFQQYYTEFPEIGLALDLSRMNFADGFFDEMEPRMQKAFSAMAELEKGAIANPDEGRMVGHYWLRTPSLAPSPEIRREIENTVIEVQHFAAEVHSGKLQGAKGAFKNLLLIGIGGSALGPQFVSHALGHPKTDKMRLHVFDNTDPDGMDRTLAQLDGALGETLCLVISKSGGTKETRNGMLEAKAAYERAGLSFGNHSVAITQEGSELDKYASSNKWLRRFPMWEWVGGRTSELSAVGLLPAALQGFDIRAMLTGAKTCDELTRRRTTRSNPSALLSLAWFSSGNGTGRRDMVVLPYKDRLELFAKYLQQLIMESLGKASDLHGNPVAQGISVFGNKGSTDQHSYVQQLRDGINNFFVTFIEVLEGRKGSSIDVEPNVKTADFLFGFLLGTRNALYEKDRESLTLTIPHVSAFSVGMLIALFERAVGLYAFLVGINAYHQPGVEGGKKAAARILELESKVHQFLSASNSTPRTVDEIGDKINEPQDRETIFKICEHLAANSDSLITKHPGNSPFSATYRAT